MFEQISLRIFYLQRVQIKTELFYFTIKSQILDLFQRPLTVIIMTTGSCFIETIVLLEFSVFSSEVSDFSSYIAFLYASYSTRKASICSLRIFSLTFSNTAYLYSTAFIIKLCQILLASSPLNFSDELTRRLVKWICNFLELSSTHS